MSDYFGKETPKLGFGLMRRRRESVQISNWEMARLRRQKEPIKLQWKERERLVTVSNADSVKMLVPSIFPL